MSVLCPSKITVFRIQLCKCREKVFSRIPSNLESNGCLHDSGLMGAYENFESQIRPTTFRAPINSRSHENFTSATSSVTCSKLAEKLEDDGSGPRKTQPISQKTASGATFHAQTKYSRDRTGWQIHCPRLISTSAKQQQGNPQMIRCGCLT